MRNHDYRSEPKGSRRSTQNRDAGKWVSNQSQPLLFAEIDDRENVCDFIRLAQLAILNPSTDPTTYMLKDGRVISDIPTGLEVKFSPNVIRLDIQGPEYCNLSFIDLPGIIVNIDDSSEKFLVKVVENLTTGHIKSTSCIVLLAHPMTNDIEISTAWSLIKEYHAEARTLGVLTKADRLLGQGSSTRWQRILLGRSNFRLGHGFHAVMMNPDLTEADFFQTPEWQDVMSTASMKVGTQSLAIALEDLLAQKISADLPNIIQKIRSQANNINQLLKLYSPLCSTDQRATELVRLLEKFAFDLGVLFNSHRGDAAADRLKHKWIHLVTAFKSALTNSSPVLDPISAPEMKYLQRNGAITSSTTSRTSKISNLRPSSPVIISDEEDEVFVDTKKLRKRFTLDEIKRINQACNSANIPNQIAERAIDKMNQECVSHWKKVTTEFLTRVGEMIRGEVKKLVKQAFQAYRSTQAYAQAVGIIEKFMDESVERQLAQALGTCRMEQTRPITFDAAGLARQKSLAFKKLQANRLEYRLQIAQTEADIRQLKNDEGMPIGRRTVVKEEEVSAIPDRLEIYVEMMAASTSEIVICLCTNHSQINQAYYQIASSRFLDCICQSIQFKLYETCATELQPALVAHFGTTKDDGK